MKEIKFNKILKIIKKLINKMINLKILKVCFK